VRAAAIIFARSLAPAALAAAAAGGCGRPAAAPPASTAAATPGELRVWSVYGGRIESRRVHTLRSQLGGQATLVELAPDGARVRAGDIVARFDATRIEREIVRLEAAHAAVRAEYEILRNADWPLKIADLERQRAEARARVAEEERLLADNRELRADGLIPDHEVRQQEARLEQALAKAAQIEQQLRLTREFLQPLGLEQARARLAAAERELEMARQELRACALAAPADGMLGHLPTHIGGEYRTARVGDTLYLNQPFLIIPDLTQLVAQIAVPEAELGRVALGAPVRVIPAAFPETELAAEVESIGATAQAAAGRPAWQRYFPVVCALREGDPRLRAGMSATVRVLSYENARALRVPRAAVRWDGGRPSVRLRRPDGGVETRPVTLGAADDLYFEALDGLAPGDVILLE